MIPHSWKVSSISVDGYYDGQPCKVFRAKCQNEGCNATTSFPAHLMKRGSVVPGNGSCQGVPVISERATGVLSAGAAMERRGNSAAKLQPFPRPDAGAENAEILVGCALPQHGLLALPAPRPAEVVKGDQPVSEATQPEATNIPDKEATVTGKGAGGENYKKHRDYLEHKAEILQDLKAIGRAATLKKWGIPPGTFAGWCRTWPELQQEARVMDGNGRVVQTIQLENVKALNLVEHGRRHGLSKPSVSRERMSELIRKWGHANDHPEYLRGLNDAARLVEVA